MGYRSAVREALVVALVAFALFGLLKGALLDRLEGVLLLSVLAIYFGATFWLELRSRDSKMFEHETEEFESLGVKRMGLATVLWLVHRSACCWPKPTGLKRGIDRESVRRFRFCDRLVSRCHRQCNREQHLQRAGNPGNTTAIIPIEISDRLRGFDMVFMLLLSCALAVVVFATRGIGRAAGLVLLGGYAVYIGDLFQSGGVS